MNHFSYPDDPQRVNPPDDGESYRDLCYREKTTFQLEGEINNQIMEALLDKREHVWLLGFNGEYRIFTKSEIKFLVVDHLSSREVLKCILCLTGDSENKPLPNTLLGWVNENSERTARFLFDRDYQKQRSSC